MATLAYGPRWALLDNAAIGQQYYDGLRLFLQSEDALIFPSSINTTTVVPPSSPNPGDQYLLLSTPSGVWTGYQNYLVYWNAQNTNTGTNTLNPSWLFIAPKVGMLIWDIASSQLYLYSAGAWSPFVASVSYPISIANGGTGSITAPDALTALGAAASGANSDITSLSAIGAGGITVSTLGSVDVGVTTINNGGIDAGSGIFGDILVSGTITTGQIQAGVPGNPVHIISTGALASLTVATGIDVIGFFQTTNAGSSTTITAQSGAGSGASASLATGSTDMAGNFTITTGTGASSNSRLASITFGTDYPSANWFITIGNTSQETSNFLNYYITSKSTTGFDIFSGGSAPSDSTSYTWDYHIIQGSV